ncbi:hypothetical protein PISL3812_05468 [Talaromyces islandicus]|uniref:Trichodiene oxygenase n=1 Tax=Talaromyces islandicus TaxID=28573 RepID=A0A0U1LYL7_TALIS|nr:hypothetical protein PISL3812_05468 [Talaromyces islandicus]
MVDAIALVGAAAVLYVAYLVVSRLFLSPLAKFPGPKLAALSNWYEFYYDVILQGRFTAHVQDLHKCYGPIIRITPTELHVDDPDFFDVLYARDGRRNKYAYFSGRFGYASDSFSTIQHELHQLRRKPLSPFFSAKRIVDFQPVIRAKVEKLSRKLVDYASDGRVLPLSRAFMALTTDIITEYAFAKSYDQLDSPDFEDTLHDALVAIYTTGHFALHFPVVFPILDSLPDWLVTKMEPRLLPVVGLRKDLGRRVGEIRSGLNNQHAKVDHPTIFHELLNSDLPEEEKSDARLGDEAQLIIAAGLITTSWALSVAGFHIINNPLVAAKLRQELQDADAAIFKADWHALEKIPYLYGCVREGIRLAHGVVTRNPRLLPDTELTYGEWVIPRNTPVSSTSVDILMNEKIFPSPREFKPERWINNTTLDRYFVPFGKGSRMCLGLNLAQAELYIAIATIFSRFDFELYDTDVSDVEMKHAYLVPYAKWESKGVRAKVKSTL